MISKLNKHSRLIMLTAGTFGQLVLQTVLQIVCARIYGTALEMDASTAALIIPLALTGLIAMPLSAVTIPQLQKLSLENDSDQTAHRSASWLITVIIVMGIGLSFAMTLGASWVVGLLYPELNKSAASETSRQLQLLSWMLPANLLIAITQNISHWKCRFLFPVLGGLIGPLTTVLMTAQFGRSWGIDALNWGLVIGAWFGALVQFGGVWRLLSWPDANPKWLKGLLLLAFPIVLGNLALRLEPLIDRSFSSGLQQGTLAQLGYASRIVLALCSLSAGGISTLIFPQLSSAAHDRKLLQSVYEKAMETLVYLLMPVLVAVGCFHHQIVSDLLERGEFTAADTMNVSMLMAGSLGVIAGAGFGEITARTFFALNQTRWPVLISTPILLAGFVTKAFVVERFGVLSLVIISSVVYLLSAVVQMSVLWSHFQVKVANGFIKAVLISLLCCLPSVLIGWGLIHFGFRYPAVWGGVTGVLSYGIAISAVMSLFRRYGSHA